MQAYVRDIYDLKSIPEENTATDVIGAGTATARSQSYGSYEKRSLWIDGMFDYQAVSDYLPTMAPLFLGQGEANVSYTINITNDVILETPDENFLVVPVQPGRCPLTLHGFPSTFWKGLVRLVRPTLPITRHLPRAVGQALEQGDHH